ncbi:homeodomain-like transcriptional regulator-like, partial [Trifolium medium]|nr:homeodomain-like transcriptional regulator-like [Trifolium medium]
AKPRNKMPNRKTTLQEKRKQFVQKRAGESNQYVTQNQPPIEKCELALDSSISEEGVDHISMLIDDEELELRELQEGTNLLICPDQLAASGMLGSSLCPGNFGENKCASQVPLRCCQDEETYTLATLGFLPRTCEEII